MKYNPALTAVLPDPNQEYYREYAAPLYAQSRCAPVNDIHNWLKATTSLESKVPAHRPETSLPRPASRRNFYILLMNKWRRGLPENTATNSETCR